MRGWLVPCGIVFATGCQVVFPLTESVPECPGPDLAPDADEDHDGTLNRDDACPLIANEGTHDEDGDGLIDACDPCPFLGVAESGGDTDCDGVANACDPDDTIPNAIRFFGFGDGNKLRLEENVTLVGDNLRLVPSTDDPSFSFASADDDGVPSGTYEVELTSTNWNVDQEIDAGFRFEGFPDNDSQRYGAVIASFHGASKLAIASFGSGGAEIASVGIQLGTVVHVHLRARIVGNMIHLEASGDVAASVDGVLPNLAAVIHYGVQAHDATKYGLAIDAAYLARITSQ